MASQGNKKGIGKRGRAWRHQETADLLALWGDEAVQMDLRFNKRNIEIFENIAKSMQDMGHDRTAEECRAKTKALRLEYKKVVAQNLRPGNSRHLYEFFSELKNILGYDASINPPVLSQSLDVEERVLQTPTEEETEHARFVLQATGIQSVDPEYKACPSTSHDHQAINTRDMAAPSTSHGLQTINPRDIAAPSTSRESLSRPQFHHGQRSDSHTDFSGSTARNSAAQIANITDVQDILPGRVFHLPQDSTVGCQDVGLEVDEDDSSPKTVESLVDSVPSPAQPSFTGHLFDQVAPRATEGNIQASSQNGRSSYNSDKENGLSCAEDHNMEDACSESCNDHIPVSQTLDDYYVRSCLRMDQRLESAFRESHELEMRRFEREELYRQQEAERWEREEKHLVRMLDCMAEMRKDMSALVAALIRLAPAQTPSAPPSEEPTFHGNHTAPNTFSRGPQENDDEDDDAASLTTQESLVTQKGETLKKKAKNLSLDTTLATKRRRFPPQKFDC